MTVISTCRRAVPVLGLLALTFGAARPSRAQQAPVHFTDVAAEYGLDQINVAGAAAKEYIVQSTGNGGGLVDFDGDGDVDVLLAQGSTLVREGADEPLVFLYRNDGAGALVPYSIDSGLTDVGWANGLCAADYDNDGDQDLYVTAHGANAFYRNHGRGGFDRVESGAEGGDEWSTSCAFADYDGDGLVDLYVANYVVFEHERLPPRGCNYMGKPTFCGPLGMRGVADVLWRNRGDGTFEDVTQEAGLDVPGRYGMALLFADLTFDGAPDVFVANDSQPNYFFRSGADGTFQESALLSGVAVSGRAEAQAAMGVDIGDVDSDGDFDLFITNFSQDHNTLYRNDGPGVFSDITFFGGLGGESMPYLAWGTGFRDFDNDGLIDLFVANGHIYEDVASFGIGSTYREPNQLFLNRGGGRFEEVTGGAGSGLAVLESSRGAAFGDLDNDLDVDVLVVNLGAAPTLLRNDGQAERHALSVRLAGGASGADGLGALILADTGEFNQLALMRSGESYQSTHDLRAHFGLGSAEVVRALSVRWPRGLAQRLTEVPADRLLVVVEGSR